MEPIQQEVLYSETSLQEKYEKTLESIEDIFAEGGEVSKVLDELAPYMEAARHLDNCNESEAQIIYIKIGEGYERIAVFHGKTTYQLNKATAQYKSVRGQYYLEEFYRYVELQKSRGIAIKDTEASREHYLNTQPEVVKAKEKVDFYTAFLETLEGWRTKLYSDLSHARNISYNKRFTDKLPFASN